MSVTNKLYISLPAHCIQIIMGSVTMLSLLHSLPWRLSSLSDLSGMGCSNCIPFRYLFIWEDVFTLGGGFGFCVDFFDRLTEIHPCVLFDASQAVVIFDLYALL